MKPLTQEDWERLARIWFWIGSDRFWTIAFTSKSIEDDILYNAAVANRLVCNARAMHEGMKHK
jgi:hypothetical protein